MQNSEILCVDPNCSYHGKCDTIKGKCICNSGYSGKNCEGMYNGCSNDFLLSDLFFLLQ